MAGPVVGYLSSGTWLLKETACDTRTSELPAPCGGRGRREGGRKKEVFRQYSKHNSQRRHHHHIPGTRRIPRRGTHSAAAPHLSTRPVSLLDGATSVLGVSSLMGAPLKCTADLNQTPLKRAPSSLGKPPKLR